jgi:hypothetical protein
MISEENVKASLKPWPIRNRKGRMASAKTGGDAALLVLFVLVEGRD